MGQRKSIQRQAVFHLISKYEDLLESKGGVCFPDERPFHTLIDYFEGEHLLGRALEVAGHAILQFGYAPEFYLRKAEILLEKKKPEQALATLDQLDGLVPGCLSTSLLRAEGLAAMGMQHEAILLLDGLKSDATDSEMSDIYVREALIFHQAKQYERMFYVLKAALKYSPTNNEALSRMWYCVEHARKHEESIVLHHAILDEHPYCTLAWYNLGAAYYYECEYEKAAEAYEYAFLTREDFEFAYRDCAEVCLLRQDYHKALQCYQEVLERFEPDGDLFLQIGKCYLYLGNFLVARTFFEKATIFDPMCDESLFHIGECYAGQKLWKKAIASYLKAIRIDDRREEYYAGLAEAYCKVGNYKKAQTFFRTATEVAPDDASYWIKYACFFMERRELEAALSVLEEAEEYTYSPAFLYHRSAFLFKLGKKREAFLTLEDALCEDYESRNSLFDLHPMLENDREVQAVISIFQPE